MIGKKSGLLRIGLMFTAVAFMAYGVLRGEADTVLTKAVNICLECIGIG